METNAQLNRLGFSDQYIKKALDMNVKLVISTDDHSIGDCDTMKYGVYQARKGWCEANYVINRLDLGDLLSLIK